MQEATQEEKTVSQQTTESVITPELETTPSSQPQEQNFTVTGGKETLIEIKQKEAATEVLYPERVVHKEAVTAAPMSAEVSQQTTTEENKSEQSDVEPKNKALVNAKSLFKMTMLAFAISMLFSLAGPLAYLWFLPAGASILIPIVLFITGVFTLRKGGGELIVFAIMFFITALIVGVGTCYANMFLMSWVGSLHF